MTPADAARMLIEWEQTKMLYALALLAGVVVVGLGAKWWDGRRGGSINDNPNPAPKGPPPVVQTRPRPPLP